jgi:hypothetical protein
MASYKNGKRNGWTYNNKSLKENIENNEHIKKIRKKLMNEKLKKHLEK